MVESHTIALLCRKNRNLRSLESVHFHFFAQSFNLRVQILCLTGVHFLSGSFQNSEHLIDEIQNPFLKIVLKRNPRVHLNSAVLVQKNKDGLNVVLPETFGAFTERIRILGVVVENPGREIMEFESLSIDDRINEFQIGEGLPNALLGVSQNINDFLTLLRTQRGGNVVGTESFFEKQIEIVDAEHQDQKSKE